MAWVKVDDGFYGHPKVVMAGNAAIGLWVRAAAYSAHYLTDGFVPESMLPILGGTKKQAEKLVNSGLWITVAGGWVFHDWDEYQPSKNQTLEARARDTLRKRYTRTKG